MELVDTRSIENVAIAVLPIEVSTSWMDLIANYLRGGCLSNIGAEHTRLKLGPLTSASFDNKMYQKSYHDPYLLCVGPSEAEHVIAAIQLGGCDNHADGRSLA